MTILLVFLLAELIVRFFKLAPLPKGQNLYRESNIGYELKQNIAQQVETSTFDKFSVCHNQAGLRDKNRSKKKKFRILAIGDSFTYGWGVEFSDTFLYLLEYWLGIEIIKAGIPGYDTTAERKFLEKYIDFYEPDMVLLCYAPNDSVVLRNENYVVTKNGYIMWDNLLYKISWYLNFYCHLFRFVSRKLASFATHWLQDNMSMVTKEIDLMKRMCNLVVLVLPDVGKQDLRLIEWLIRNNVPMIDTSYHNQEYLFLKDGHLNAEGHETVARMAYNKLKAMVEK